MMTIDDEGGRGGFWPMMTSSQKPQIFGIFLRFFEEFFKIVLKIYKIRAKTSNFSRKLKLLSECYFIFMASHKRVGSLSGFWGLVKLLLSFIGQVG